MTSRTEPENKARARTLTAKDCLAIQADVEKLRKRLEAKCLINEYGVQEAGDGASKPLAKAIGALWTAYWSLTDTAKDLALEEVRRS